MATEQLPLGLVLVEDLLANKISSADYKRWVAGLGLKSTDRVLDVGARSGADSRYIAPLVEKGSVTCLDIDGRWLDVARKRLHAYANVEYVEADACEWCSAAKYDVAVMDFVLHDIPSESRSAALCHIQDSLVEGGRLCLREPISNGLGEAELNQLLADAGFEHVGSDAHGKKAFAGQWVSAVWRKRSLVPA
jgi:ubiquinone/menaquinone biosynthesis C-methylase UbiE